MSICHSSVGSGKIMQSARTHETHPPTVLGAYFPPMYMDTTFFSNLKKIPKPIYIYTILKKSMGLVGYVILQLKYNLTIYKN